LKICRDVNKPISRALTRMNADFFRTAALLAVLTSVAMPVRGQSHTPARPQPQSGAGVQTQAELSALHALMKLVETQSPRPPKVSATQISSNGYWETQDLTVAWYGVMRRFLPTVRSVHPELVTYWVVRTEGSGEGGFAAEARRVVASTPALAPWADQLKSASDALIREAKQREHIIISGAPGQERDAMNRALDLPGKRRALIGVVQEILGAAGEIGPESNGAWLPLYQFLTRDADDQWNSSLQARDRERSIAFELHGSFWGAMEAPAASTAWFHKLEAIAKRLDSLKVQLLVSALAPGQTPMAFLENDAREFISTQIEFDHELVRALDSPETRANPSMIRVFDGLYPVWRSLERREYLLSTGRWTQAVGVLIETARSLLMAESWEWNEPDSDTGRTETDFAVQRAGQTMDTLHRYSEGRLNPGVPGAPLYAAVEVDQQGRRLWTHSGWMVWKWISAADLDDLVVDGRIVEGLGRRWLLPAGSPVKSIHSLQDVSTAHAREVIVGLDPQGAWAAQQGKAVSRQ
jgi:hypothetical protein